ncbi:hypothetical protein D1115_03690 [Vibrio alfacsensis]|uniref:Uncharacterized protein n=1 Tax=Vibrio alfacsensis TaxID=1074311 RepID=A0ABN5PB67_9VIBR|nr:hypothetical protein [Vibrio alfacsensis]AXY00468.1 hypothetical protein D1115_03690 [Vibrio alfacsensis]
MLQDLAKGKISHAYINKQLLESIYAKVMVKIWGLLLFQVVIMSILISKPHAFRIEDKNLVTLIEEAFHIFTQKELDSMLRKYSKVEYNIGYQKSHVEYFAVLGFILSFVFVFVYLSMSKLKERAIGANKNRIIGSSKALVSRYT